MNCDYHDLILESIELDFTKDSTFLVVLAIHNDFDKNLVKEVSFGYGIPIEGHVYDDVSNNYIVYCSDTLNLGLVPISVWQTIKGISSWRQRIPLPEKLIEKLLNEEQARDLKYFKSVHGNVNYKFSFLQFIGCD